MSNKRSRARHHAVQALYQWQVAGGNLAEIEEQFLSDESVTTFELDYFKELLHGIPQHLTELDARLAPLLSRSIESVDPVERAILRLGAYELMHKPEIPYRVVINECVELAKVFGAEQGHRFVNGVLDKMAQTARGAEVKMRQTR